VGLPRTDFVSCGRAITAFEVLRGSLRPYPDAVQTDDGTIYVVYDRKRFKEMATFLEEDVRAGCGVSGKERWHVVFSTGGSQ